MSPAHGNATHDTGTAGLPGDARLDERLIRARIDREREEARFQARLAERQAPARLRREDAEARNAARDKARQSRGLRRRHDHQPPEAPGQARLVFEPGTAWLSRDRLGRRRLELDDLGPVLGVAPVRVADSVPTQSVRVPEPVYGPEPVQPARTDSANHGQIASQASQSTAPEQADGAGAVGALGNLNADAGIRLSTGTPW
jgi:hypothetical protein